MSEDNVVEFHGPSCLDLPAERVLRKALEADMQGVVVLGYDASGAEYFASSYAGGGDMLWLLERAKKMLLATVDEDDE